MNEKLIKAAKEILEAPWQAQLGKQDMVVLIVSGFQLSQLKQAIEELEKNSIAPQGSDNK
jgi:hypothetical protein